MAAAEEIRKHLADLESSHRSVREGALASLVAAGSEAVAPLCDALRSGKGHLPRRASEALGRLGEQALPSLQGLLKVRHRDVRARAALALGLIGGPNVLPPLCEALERDRSALVSARAAEALGRVGSTQACPPLCRALRHRHPTVRLQAARALGRVGTPDAVAPLCRALQDRDAQARRATAQALGSLAERCPTPSLRMALPLLLRSRTLFWLSSDRAVYQSAADRIEAATAAMKDLPLPSEVDRPGSETLPAPASAPSHDERLPIAAERAPRPATDGHPMSESDPGKGDTDLPPKQEANGRDWWSRLKSILGSAWHD